MKYTVQIVGVTFEGRQDWIAKMSEGDEVLLQPEPGNEFDPNAIAVLWKGMTIGYLPRDVAADIAPRMEGNAADGVVEKVLGGDPAKPTYGLLIVFEL